MLRTSWLWGSFLLVPCFALVQSQGPEPAKSDKDDVRQCWEDLASADASVAYRGMWRLVQAPRQTIAFLDQHLPLAVSPDPKKVEQFIRDLASDNFAVRNQANRELENLGTLVEPALQKALARKLPLEAQRRMERLLNLLASTVTSPTTLRELRAVETLEIIGTREAKKLLHRLAQGAPLARLSREAKESLDRLGVRLSSPTPTNLPLTPARTDLYGDLLPAMAHARLGTMRFRHSGSNYKSLKLAFSPDNKMLASMSAGFFQLWEARSGKLRRRIDSADSGGNGSGEAFAFSPDGKVLALSAMGDQIL